MGRIEKAIAYRDRHEANLKAVQSLIRIDELTEEELEDIIKIYPKWKEEVEYTKDQLIRHGCILHKVIQSHTSEAHFLPEITNYWYVEAYSPAEVIPVWKKPSGAENTYPKGFRVIYEPDGEIYESLIAANNEEPTKDEPHNRYWKKI